MTELESAIEPYLDPETGLVRAANGGTDNLPLFSATLITLLPLGSRHRQLQRAREEIKALKKLNKSLEKSAKNWMFRCDELINKYEPRIVVAHE